MIEEKIENISEEELEYEECIRNPVCLIESYFHNFDSLGNFNPEFLGDVRKYQLPMISYEPMIDTENRPEMTLVEKFNLRKTVGDCYNFGSRLYGKTLCSMKLDLMVTVIHAKGEQIGFTSVSDEKIRTVLDDVSEGLENHPFYKMYNVKCKRSPYNIRLNNGCRIIGINMNIGKKNAGDQFMGKHYKRLYLEESSMEPDMVYEKRKDSVSELGCVIRQASMCNFTEHSPAGKQFYDPNNRMKVINYPQFVNPIAWNEKEKQNKLKDFGGSDSWFWKTFVEGEVLTDGVSEIDMERIQYDKKKTIKSFILRKDKYKKFKDIIICERPSNADEIYICFEEGTEILTNEGWKDFRNVTYNDKVLSLNPSNGQSSYKPINNIIVQDYEGNMIEHESETLKFSVTPNHKMFVKKAHHDKFEFIDAKNLTESYVKRDLGHFKNGKSWYRKSGNNRMASIKFKAKSSKTYIFDLSDWLEFLGWYLSEGCIIANQNYRIVISQKKEIGRIKIKKLLDRMKWNYQELPGEFVMNSKPIYNWLMQNCYKGNKIKKKSIYNCYNKKIPNFVRNLNSKLINIFLESFIDGDGWRTKDGRVAMITTSYRLANDFMELVLMTGKIATMEFRNPEPRMFPGRDNASICQRAYIVNIWRKNTNSKIRPSNLKKKYYNGKVYCVETNPYHTIYVKYKGKSFWCGNCADIGDGRGGTEIMIFSKVGKKFVYLYNITLYSFTDEEQYEVFKWLGQKLGANVIALDLGDGTGRSIFRRLEKIFPKECLVGYSGKEKIAVDYEKDDNGNVKYEKGKPITKDEIMASWGFLYLRDMLYEAKIIMPLQYKLDRQLSQVISLQSKDGTRRRYFCGLEDNHLFDTFRIFAIAVWEKEGLSLKQVKQEWGLGSNSGMKKKTENRECQFKNAVWGLGS